MTEAVILDFQKGQRVLRPLSVFSNSQARLKSIEEKRRVASTTVLQLPGRDDGQAPIICPAENDPSVA